MKLRNIILGLLLVLAASSCRPSAEYYVLEGGDPNIDWFEFVNDSTINWVGPGPLSLQSIYEEDSEGNIVVYVAPYSKGYMKRIDSRTIEGQVPFFEGTWKKSRPRR